MYINEGNGKQVFKHTETKILEHEIITAKKLTEVNYDVIFAPKGMFKRGQKKFDIYAIYNNNVIFEADLKANFVATKNSIFNLIKSGDQQAKQIILEIKSSIKVDDLINGLKEGIREGRNVQTIMLFYKKLFFNLNRNTILSNKIYKLLK